MEAKGNVRENDWTNTLVEERMSVLQLIEKHWEEKAKKILEILMEKNVILWED